MIKNIKSPSITQTAVLDRQARKNSLQNRDSKQYLGGGVQKYNPTSKNSTDRTVVCTVTKLTAGENARTKNFIILDNGQGVLFKRTEVMLLKMKSEGSRKGRNSSFFGENNPKLKSVRFGNTKYLILF